LIPKDEPPKNESEKVGEDLFITSA
jgi:hypothetical protein